MQSRRNYISLGVENTWFVSPNQLERDCRQIARQKSKSRLHFSTGEPLCPVRPRSFPPSSSVIFPRGAESLRLPGECDTTSRRGSRIRTSAILPQEKQENSRSAGPDLLRIRIKRRNKVPTKNMKEKTAELVAGKNKNDARKVSFSPRSISG